MRARSEAFLDTDLLTVQLVSNEDICLFKTIAGRDDDIEDMNMLIQAGLDFDVVEAELDKPNPNAVTPWMRRSHN